MLLDARGHLKLTDLGLCKKVGEVSPTDHPDMVLKTLKDQGIQLGNEEMSDSGNPGTQQLAGSGRHRDSSDAMAMSIDDGAEVGIASSGQRPANLPGAKARREVSMPSNETMCRVRAKLCSLIPYTSFWLFICADGIFNSRHSRLHCARSARSSEWCIWIFVHLRC